MRPGTRIAPEQDRNMVLKETKLLSNGLMHLVTNKKNELIKIKRKKYIKIGFTAFLTATQSLHPAKQMTSVKI